MSRKRESPPPQSVRFYVECYGIGALLTLAICVIGTLAARLTSALGWTP